MPHQQPGRRARLAWALLGLTVALVAAAIAIGLARGERWNAVFGFIPVALAFTVVGALVAARTGNRLGWLFLVTGTLSAATLVLDNYAARAARAAPPGRCFPTILFQPAGSARSPPKSRRFCRRRLTTVSPIISWA